MKSCSANGFRRIIERWRGVQTPPIEAAFLSYRCYGDEKISRPKILKGLKPVCKSTIYGRSASVFLPPDNSVVVYFGELFCKYLEVPSEEDVDLPTIALQKKYDWYPRKKTRDGFIYSDGWCIAFKRNEGYVRFTGLREQFDGCEFDWPFIPAVGEAVYKCLEGLSRQDMRFYWLNGTCEQSAQYIRVSNDIVSFIVRTRKEQINKRSSPK